MRDYSNIDRYLDELQKDIYPAPVDPGHASWSHDVISRFCADLPVSSVLDAGCGEGFCQPMFGALGIEYTGVTLGENEIAIAKNKVRNVYRMDMNFLSYPDNNFDMVFARHSLEHSPFPILTLMEWKRVAKKYILLVLPAPEYWEYHGQNHYYVLEHGQWWNLFQKVGLRIIKEEDFKTSQKLFLDYYLPQSKDRSNVVYPGRPKIVEFRWLLEII